MANLIISGNTNPEVGKETVYSILTIALNTTIHNPLSPISTQQAHWEIYIFEKRRWRKADGNTKYGDTVSYNFKQSSLVREGVKIVVARGNDKGELIIKPKKAGAPKVNSVNLFDRNYNKITKPLNYSDTIIAKAHCTDMEGEKVYFTLWEDDAIGSGHDTINNINKINPIPISNTVKNGIAEVKFNMSLYTMASRIADMQVAKGDKSEGKNHEYYVTVDFYGKIAAESKNINIKNPNDNLIQRAYELQYPERVPQKPKQPNKQPTPPPVKPKKDTFKAPVTAGAKTKAPDPKGKILSTHFVNSAQQPIKDLQMGVPFHVKIRSNGLKGKTVTLRLFEEDNSFDDLVYVKNILISSDIILHRIAITDEMRKKGGDLYGQQYYIEIEYSAQSVKSSVLNLRDDAILTKLKTAVSTAGVKKQEVKKENKNCGGRYCIKKGDKNELIREINIRLAGFGGNVPTDKFTSNTEKMIKQFQRDYMKVNETGSICGNVLKAIDEFCNKYVEKINDYKCPCQNPNNSTENQKASRGNRCSEGWGKGLYANQYMNHTIREPHRKYEYPGMHRSTLWAVSAMKFYLDFTKSKYKKYDVNRGYRCWADNDFHNRRSTNHFGKAADIRFTKNGIRTYDASDANAIRDNIFKKYLNAKWWGNPNFFTLEKESDGAVSYVHVDCRDFDLEYYDNKFFIKSQQNVIGKSLITLATELGFKNMCSCYGNFSVNVNKENLNNGRVDPKTLKTSEKGKTFIRDFEKYSATLYNDDAKERNCTIGYGYLVHKGPCNGSEPEEFKKRISMTRALQLFNEKIKKFEMAVQRDIRVKLYQHEFDALVSLLFNTGSEFLNVGGLNNGETKIKKYINNNDYNNGADEFLDVTNGGLSGLVIRRKAEINIFKNNIYDSKH